MPLKEELMEMILSSDTLSEAFAIFINNLDLLSDCRFIFFDKKRQVLPKIVNNIYSDGTTRGYAVYTLSCNDGYFLLDEESAKRMLCVGETTIPLTICLNLDTQILTDLRHFYEGNPLVPEMFKDLVKDCTDFCCDYTCLPYMIENSSKLDDPQTLNEAVKTLNVYNHFKTQPLNEFKHGFPFAPDTYKETHTLVNMMNEGGSPYGELAPFIKIQKAIQCLLLQCAIISLKFRKKSEKEKLLMLIDFVNSKLGILLERELSVCCLHLKNDARVQKFFKKFKNSVSFTNLKNAILSMSWDLFHLRLLEITTAMDMDRNDSISLHALVTRDYGFQDIIKVTPIDRMVVVQNTGTLMPTIKCKYSLSFRALVEKAFDFERIVNCNHDLRAQIREKVDFDVLISVLQEELEDFLRQTQNNV